MSFKAQELAHELASELKIRMTGLALVEGFDTNGDPTIAIGPGGDGEANAFIRVKAIDWALAKDVLGLPSTVYTPHVIQMATEGNFLFLSPQQSLDLVAAISKRGTKVELWQEASGTEPAVTTFNTASKLKATYEAEMYWGMKASQ